MAWSEEVEPRLLGFSSCKVCGRMSAMLHAHLDVAVNRISEYRRGSGNISLKQLDIQPNM